MSNEPTDTNLGVDVNTDDLDAFNTLLHGTAKAKEEVKETPKEEVETDEDVDTVGEQNDSNADNEDNSEDNPDGDDEDEKSEEKPKKVNRFQERINELTAKAKEAERREAEVLRKLQELEAKQNGNDPKPAAQTESKAQLPNPDAKNEDGSDKYPLGEFDPAYIRDLNRAIIEEERKSYKEQEERERVDRQIKDSRDALQAQWAEKLAPITEQHDDYIEKTLQLENTFDGLDANYSDYLVQTIKSLDHGPEVLYYLANNLEDAKKFVHSGPLGATLALGELNAMFKSQSRKETKVSKAPVPPQVGTKGTSVRRTISADTDDLDAFSDVFFPKKKK